MHFLVLTGDLKKTKCVAWVHGLVISPFENYRSGKWKLELFLNSERFHN